MTYGILLEFDDSVGKKQYDAVNEQLGLDPVKGTGDWPDGLISHAGGTLSDGFIVYEVWESQAKQEAFMAGRLGAALGHRRRHRRLPHALTPARLCALQQRTTASSASSRIVVPCPGGPVSSSRNT
jgi:hypothetical protein